MENREILHKLENYVQFLKESGFIVLDRNPGSHTGISESEIAERTSLLRKVAEKIANCTKCRLSEGRTNTVPGDGYAAASLVFVGEAPGYYEDRQGIPFVGKAGHLLDKLLGEIGLKKQNVFITNVCKCRPPNNRDPRPDEIEACEPYLLAQLEILNPKVICTLGRYATQTLLHTTDGINRLRGRFYEYHNIPLLPTLHPAAVLRNANQLADVEMDFKHLSEKLQELEG